MLPGELGLQDNKLPDTQPEGKPSLAETAFPAFSEAIGSNNKLGTQFYPSIPTQQNSADHLQVKFMNSAATEESKSSLFGSVNYSPHDTKAKQ